MIEVRRRTDDELCGFVDWTDARWRALTVFGGVLGEHDTREAAERDVLDRGLASLALRWELVDRDAGTEEAVLIQEARRDRVTVALAPYSIPGVPTRTLTAAELRDGGVELRLG